MTGNAAGLPTAGMRHRTAAHKPRDNNHREWGRARPWAWKISVISVYYASHFPGGAQRSENHCTKDTSE